LFCFIWMRALISARASWLRRIVSPIDSPKREPVSYGKVRLSMNDSYGVTFAIDNFRAGNFADNIRWIAT